MGRCNIIPTAVPIDFLQVTWMPMYGHFQAGIVITEVKEREMASNEIYASQEMIGGWHLC